MHVSNLLLLLFIGGLSSSCQSQPNAQTVRFKVIADTQQRSNERTLREANKMIERLAADVEANRYQRGDAAALKQAEAILGYMKITIGQLQEARAAINSHLDKEQDGGLDSHGIVEEVLLQRNKPTSADSLQHHLRAFVAYMKPLVSQPPYFLGLVPEDAVPPTSTNQEASEPAAYGRFYFEGTTAAEALAMLTQQEAEVLRSGLEGIAEQSKKVGRGLVFDKIGPYAVAESKTVRPGEKYSADLMIVSSSGTKSLQMTANGNTIPVERSTGRGRVEFVVPPLPPGQNSKQAYWDGTISLHSYGRDTTFRVRVPYTIINK